jgi:hypothetical protein
MSVIARQHEQKQNTSGFRKKQAKERLDKIYNGVR